MALAAKKLPFQRPVSLRDQAYEVIKHKIITCELRPGELLSEAVLSADLDIGRTPVRQAIDRLMGDGLVEVMPRKGSIVKPVSIDEIMCIIDVRLLNETHCARVAASTASTALQAQLKQNVAGMWKAAKARQIETAAALDQEFHTLISGATRNLVLIDILRNLHERSTRMWFISLRANEQHLRVCDEHEAIIASILKRDPDKAEAAMRQHIESYRSNVARQL